MKQGESSDTQFTSAMALTKMGLSDVPQRYILPPSQRPNPTLVVNPTTTLSLIDLSHLDNPSLRTEKIKEIRMACKEFGFFQVINHGISMAVINDALDSAKEFFNLATEEKMSLFSDDIHEPVRYGTSMNHVKDKVHFWRDFIKHYSHPISSWIDQWPSNPPCYKEKMGNYAREAYLLHKKLVAVVWQSLGLEPTYMNEDIEEGSQVMAVNCYPACPQPDLALGMPPHSDFGFLTIINQSHQGLEIMDRDKNWHSVPVIEGALVVQLGDQMEVMTNGRYKSVVHRAIVNSDNKRISIASLHSLALEKKVVPAPELVDDQHPMSYKEGSFNDFLEYISGNDIMDGRYIDTLKM